MPKYNVIGSQIDCIGLNESINIIINWAKDRQSRSVLLCNVHSVVTARLDRSYLSVVNKADLALPDGAPIAWAIRRYGRFNQKRISGPDLMEALIDRSEVEGLNIYFYGCTDKVLNLIKKRINMKYRNINVFTKSPPYRELTKEEEISDINSINAANTNILFVGLGCPKQEKWILEHKNKINSVMIGVGAAFNFYSGISKRAPFFMRNNGLEWLFRLFDEPKRLFGRYFVTNSLFIIFIILQIFSSNRN